jgi:hypothetical protein
MNIDPIVKEELLRSFPVLFFSFLIIGLLKREGYISIEMSGVLILALFLQLSISRLWSGIEKRNKLIAILSFL